MIWYLLLTRVFSLEVLRQCQSYVAIFDQISVFYHLWLVYVKRLAFTWGVLACLQTVVCDSVAMLDVWKIWDEWQSEGEGGGGEKVPSLPLSLPLPPHPLALLLVPDFPLVQYGDRITNYRLQAG